LAHGFRGFSSWSLGSVVYGPVVRQNIVEGAHVEKIAHLMVQRKGRGRGERERERG
jgi:hypothetical protein